MLWDDDAQAIGIARKAGKRRPFLFPRQPSGQAGPQAASLPPEIAERKERIRDKDEQARKTALRMILYGIYVMTAKARGAAPAAATVNWVTQTSFSPPFVAVGVKTDSGVYAATRAAGHFVLNVLGKGQQGAAFAFFKPAELEDGKLSGEEIEWAANGALML